MAAKYTIDSSVTAGDRGPGSLPNQLKRLSTGEAVFLVNNPAVSGAPFELWVASGATRAITAKIASISVGSGSFDSTPGPALSVDSSDNLYLTGRAYSDTDDAAAQAFSKGSGLSWTQGAFVASDVSGTDGWNPQSLAATWCNTGGGTSGKGHIVTPISFQNNSGGVTVYNAGAILAGSPSFVSDSQSGLTYHPLSGSAIDIAGDGAGATSGLWAWMISGNLQVTGWGVTGAGKFTQGGGLSDSRPIQSLPKVRVVRCNPNLFAVIYRSNTSPYTALTVRFYSATAMLASIDTTATSNFPLNGNTVNWDATVNSVMTDLWVYGWSSVSPFTTLLREGIDFSTPSAPAITTVVSEPDTPLGTGNTALRAVKDPVDVNLIDWQTYNATSSYSLLGGISSIPSVAQLASLLSPASGTVVPFVQSGGTFTWHYNPAFGSDVQTAWYFRRLNPATGNFQWWRASDSTWQNAETANSGTASSLTVAAADANWVAGQTYSWAVQVANANGVSGYTGAWNVVVANPPPPTPVLTVARDNPNNRTSLALAKGAADGSGGNGASIAYSLELSDDGGATWSFRRGSSSRTDFATTLYDYDTANGVSRQYRARTWTAYPTSYSPYHTQTAAAASITTFWLADISAGTPGITIKVLKGSLSTLYPARAAVHVGLGRADEIVIEDTLGLESGQCTIFTLSATEETAVLALLNSQHTLLLQVPDGRQFFCRIVSDRTVDQNGALAIPGAYRQHNISFRGQARPQ